MFKIGDKVKCKENYIHNFSIRNYGFYLVKKLYGSKMSVTDLVGKVIGYHEDNNGYRYPKNLFELVESKPQTEIDFLDSFKENFKQGI